MLESILKRSNWKDFMLILISAISIIMIWRGVWNLLDAFLVPNDFVGSQIVSIVAGLWILMILSRYK